MADTKQQQISQEDPWQEISHRLHQGRCYSADGDGKSCREKYGAGSWCSACLGHAALDMLAAVHAQHVQEITRLKAELESTPYGKMRRTLLVRAEAAEAQIVTLREQQRVPGAYLCDTCGFRVQRMILRASDGAVGINRGELQDICPNDGTSLRPLTWREDAEASDRVGIEHMKRADAAEAEIARLSAQLHAKDHDIELLKHGWCVACGDGNHQHCLGGKCDCIHATGSHELANLQRQLADEQLLRRNAEAKFADLIRQIEEKTDAPTTRT